MKSHSKSTFHSFTLFALLASLLGSALIVTPVYAAGVMVTTTADEYNTGGECSLREAITATNTNTPYGGCSVALGADTITLPAGTYTLTIAGAGEDANATGDLDITDALTINGAGASSTFIQAGATPGSGIDRVLHVIGAIIVSISDVTIANGKCTSCYGGGILNAGTLTVTNSTFSGNSSTNSGGGISNNGTLTVTNSTFSGNSASYGGGIMNLGMLTITNSTFSGNSVVGGLGGGINNTGGTLTITNSSFSGNTTDSDYAGAILNDGTLHLKNTILANSGFSGDCYNGSGDTIATNTKNLIETNGPSGHMCGTPAVTTDPSLGVLADNGGPTQTFALLALSPALNAGDNATCTATDQRGVTRPQSGTCDIGAFESNAQPGPTFAVNATEDSSDGSCDAYAAGITDCTLREAISAANNLAGADVINVPAGTYTLTMAGAGDDLNATGDLDITGSVTINGAPGGTIIRAGATPGSGIDRVLQIVGAIPVSIDNVTIANGKCNLCDGGGIRNAGNLTITNSTFSGNSAAGDVGGGIDNYGGILTLTNSTFSGNSADYGGGLYNGFSMSVTNSTFSGNSAVGSLGSGIYNAGFLNLKNTILANSAGGVDCYNNGGDTIDANINNLIEANAASPNKCGTPAVTTDPGLGTLANNGGSTQTFAITDTSSAYNAGDATTCAAAPVSGLDQRGVIRPQRGSCDIGAYELDQAPLVTNVSSTTANGIYNLGDPITVTVTFDEIVNVTGTPQLTLETGTTNRIAAYASGTGTKTLTFNYVVQPGDTSSDLDYVNTNSLALNGGTIKDVTPNNAILTLFTPGASGSLGYNKAIVIDTAAPNTTINSHPSNPSIDNTPTFAFNGNDDTGSGIASFMCQMDSGGYSACSTPFTSSALLDGSHTFYVYAVDHAGNPDASPASYTWTTDTTPPTVVSSVRTNANHTSAVNVHFTVTFSESVTGVATGDFSLTTSGVSGAYVTGVSGSGTTRNVTINTGTGSGSIRLDIPISATITDPAGNPLAGRPYTGGQTYTITKVFTIFLPLNLR